VSEVIGAVIIFGAVVVAFSTYQAFAVPAQNEVTEFDHSTRVEQDLLTARNEILATKQTCADGYAVIELGAAYPNRLFAVNPHAPSGSLFTEAPCQIQVLDSGGTPVDVCPANTHRGTQRLVYRPNYNVYTGPDRYTVENTVLYRKFGPAVPSGQRHQPVTGQKLVLGERINLVPILSNVSRTSAGSVSFEPRAGQLKETTLDGPTVRVGTNLPETTWETLLRGEVENVETAVTVLPPDGSLGHGPTEYNGTLEVSLPADTEFTVACGPVAINEQPSTGDRQDGADAINPAAPGDIKLEDIQDGPGGDTVELVFNNTADGTTNFTNGRINFYEAQGGGNKQPTQAAVSNTTSGTVAATLQIEGQTERFDPKIELVGGNTQTRVTFEFDENTNSNDWFVLTMELETGEQGLYFIGVP
jgi:hypothetical protein